jgi:starch synthase
VKVLLLSAEVYPFAKTGGLGDVAGALPRALRNLGLDVAVVMPFYRKVRARRDPLDVVAEKVPCLFAGEERPFRLLQARLPGPERVPVWFVQNEGVFEEDEDIYGTSPGSYGDGHLRFLYFCFAALAIPKATGFRPDVWHLQDWQTAAVAPLLRFLKGADGRASDAATVLTIHNLAYQGVFPLDELRGAGVPEELLVEGKLAEGGRGNLLAGGLRYADALSTVSGTYAREILTPEFGNGLDPLLRWRETLLNGIVNGLDLDVWNPSTDRALPVRYDADSLPRKKKVKAELLAKLGLEPTDGPVFGVVSRFTGQKGLELVPPALARLLARRDDVRVAALGSGEKPIEGAFRELAAAHPGRAVVKLAFDEKLSHLIEAGADFFLMPSKFEPCGLNQLISMRYGTPPIVRATGGLEDTVIDATPERLADGTATGFKFRDPTVEGLAWAVDRALRLYDEEPERLDAMRKAGMTTDWSWEKSARDYLTLYETAVERRRRGAEHLEGLVPPTAPAEPHEVFLPPLAAVPDWYPRDVLTPLARDPWTLFVLWELGGDASRRRWEALDERDRGALRYVLRLVEVGTRVVADHEVGIANDWFATAVPGATYEVELLARYRDGRLEQLMTAGPVSMPPVGHPDDPEDA